MKGGIEIWSLVRAVLEPTRLKRQRGVLITDESERTIGMEVAWNGQIDGDSILDILNRTSAAGLTATMIGGRGGRITFRFYEGRNEKLGRRSGLDGNDPPGDCT